MADLFWRAGSMRRYRMAATADRRRRPDHRTIAFLSDRPGAPGPLDRPAHGRLVARPIIALCERDERDGSRADAPMRRAEDAMLLDTTHLDPDQAFESARAFVETGTI